MIIIIINIKYLKMLISLFIFEYQNKTDVKHGK